MIPISDDNSQRKTTPWVNYLLIIANFAVFFWVYYIAPNQKFLVYDLSVIPWDLQHCPWSTCLAVQAPGGPPQPLTIPSWLTLFTGMFMHAGWAHILGNMLFLFIFGDNVEDAMGHIRYLLFYLICGLLAGLTQVYVTLHFDPNAKDALVPNLGASGAIAGVLAAYLVLYPHARVNALIFIGIFFTFTRLSAVVLIGFWFITQFIPAITSLGQQASNGGVAVWAHVGGFVAGLLLVKPFQQRRPAAPYAPPPPRWYGGVTPPGGLRR
ncbi:MAG TPA: rhomboid family intramembrane serine protease [Chloroflexota bacterium]|nr:rhomboid family intramembrane serine protease [Chloroflexota bacterium]